MKYNLDDFTVEITKKSTHDTEKLKNRTLQNSRQVKETSKQEYFYNIIVAGSEVKDYAIPCCIQACLASVTV